VARHVPCPMQYMSHCAYVVTTARHPRAHSVFGFRVGSVGFVVEGCFMLSGFAVDCVGVKDLHLVAVGFRVIGWLLSTLGFMLDGFCFEV
jgi:hypothetical protein